MSDDLPDLPATPEGWAIASVRSLVRTLQYGVSTKADADSKTGVPILRMGNIQDGRLDLSDLKYVPRSKDLAAVHLTRGDLLFNRTNSPDLVGKSAVVDVDDDLVFASYLIRLATRADAVDARYLCWWINSAWGREWAARVRTDGVSQSNINGTKLGKMPVPVAPLPEQQRIVEKVEGLLEQVRRAKGRLERAPLILKRFRQAVLAAACSGELTREWRETHTGVESANATLQSLLNVRRTSKSLRQKNVPGDLLREDLPDLPEGWTWAPFDDVCDDITVGHVGPMASEYVPTGIPFLRSQNVRPFRFDPEGLKFVSTTFHKRLAKSALKPGDLVVVRSGNAGEACVVPPELAEANCADLVVMRPSQALNAHYGALFINSSSARAHIDEVKVGIAQGHFNIGSARRTPVPLPPLGEQNAIVEAARRLLDLADRIEVRVRVASARADKLPQAVLSKAFSGELVPTEADIARTEGRTYETAEQLLARTSATVIMAGVGGKRASQEKDG